MSFNKEIISFSKDLIRGPRLAFKYHSATTIIFLVALLSFIGLAVYRFQYGLGVTGINDQAPWGIWTAFKLFLVVCSGCGFVITGLVYVFKMEEFRPLVRSAALMGLIGYSTFALTLILELGWPWRIVHPVWMHNYHSILFEVAWCVILYLTILILEFLPNAFERFKLNWLLKLFKKLIPSFVIIGIILSVLHQSSLGSLFVVAPYKMNHLWYSPWVGPFFIISAVFCGLGIVIISEILMAIFDKRQPRLNILSTLGKYSIAPLSLYFGFKVMDILERDQARRAFAALDLNSFFFMIEIGLGILLPIFLFMKPKIRKSVWGLGISSGLVLTFGGALNRLNVSVIAYDHSPLGYSPTFVEYLYIPSVLLLVSGIYIIITRLFPILEPIDSSAPAKEL